MRSSKIVNLKHHSFLRLMSTARAKLDEGVDGAVELCKASDQWVADPLAYESLTPWLIDELLGTAMHPNATKTPARNLRDNLQEHIRPVQSYETDSLSDYFAPRDEAIPAVDDADLCKLQGYIAIAFLTHVANVFYEDFKSDHVSKLLTYAHLAERNQVCAVGVSNVYDCLQTLAGMNSDIFTDYHRATIAAKKRLDLQPITERKDSTNYWSILCSLDDLGHIRFKKPCYVKPGRTARFDHRIPSNDGGGLGVFSL